MAPWGIGYLTGPELHCALLFYLGNSQDGGQHAALVPIGASRRRRQMLRQRGYLSADEATAHRRPYANSRHFRRRPHALPRCAECCAWWTSLLAPVETISAARRSGGSSAPVSGACRRPADCEAGERRHSSALQLRRWRRHIIVTEKSTTHWWDVTTHWWDVKSACPIPQFAIGASLVSTHHGAAHRDCQASGAAKLQPASEQRTPLEQSSALALAA